MKGLNCKIVFFSALALGVMASSLWGSNAKLGEKVPALLVTKKVLIEYVEDRLSQLDEKGGLTEEQAEELSFILENRDDFRKLADFYGMEIKEPRPEKRRSQKKSTAREPSEKSIKEISQLGPIRADTVQKREAPIDATSTETSEKKGASAEAKLGWEMAERERPEEVEENLTGKDMKEDEEATSPEAISSALARSETLSIASSIPRPDADKGGAETSPPSITDEEVKEFLVSYVEYYNRRDIDSFLSLFSSKVTQNWAAGFDQTRRIYSDFFDQSQELRYHLEGTRIKFYQNAAEARARYEIYQMLKEDGKKKVWRGRIRWILVKENGNLKIRYLDYMQEKSSSGRIGRSTNSIRIHQHRVNRLDQS